MEFILDNCTVLWLNKGGTYNINDRAQGKIKKQRDVGVQA